MSGSSFKTVKGLLGSEFEVTHVEAAVKHFQGMIDKFVATDWEGTEQKAGKFIEAVSKALVQKANKSTIGNTRKFNAGYELRQLENVAGFPDALRLAIPRAGIFVYEIVSNRGGRHDPGEIDANEMDAKTIVPVNSWVLAELVRFCSKSSMEAATGLIEELTDKVYPYFEEIDGHTYVNLEGLKAGEIALLIMYSRFPKRVNRQHLVESVKRHEVGQSAATMAVHRLKHFVDDANGEWKLRGLGREKAEELLQSLEH